MTVSPQDNVRATARDLYEQGSNLDAIARSVNVPVMALLRWRREDEGEGRPWLRPGEPDPEKKLRLRLRKHLDELLKAAEAAKDKSRQRYPTIEDRMLKVVRVMEGLHGDGPDLDAQIATLQVFADFCVRNMMESEMAPVRKAFRLYLDYLKALHS